MTKEELTGLAEKEFEKIQAVLKELHAVAAPDKTDYTVVELAAMGSFLFGIYYGVEAALRLVLLYDSMDVSDPQCRHEDLLQKAHELGITPHDLNRVLQEYLSFRRSFEHSYSTNYDWEKLRPLVDAAGDMVRRVEAEIKEYIQTV